MWQRAEQCSTTFLIIRIKIIYLNVKEGHSVLNLKLNYNVGSEEMKILPIVHSPTHQMKGFKFDDLCLTLFIWFHLRSKCITLAQRICI